MTETKLTAAQAAAAEPRATTSVTPTPQPNEIAGFLAALGTTPMPWHLKPDGSPVDPHSFNTSAGSPTWLWAYKAPYLRPDERALFLSRAAIAGAGHHVNDAGLAANRAAR
jgi:hypothetical protein